jgi:hypothetical protein
VHAARRRVRDGATSCTGSSPTRLRPSLRRVVALRDGEELAQAAALALELRRASTMADAPGRRASPA